jgi:CRP-like cAMP-binding protein/predicted MFS family arabinose efflux permease
MSQRKSIYRAAFRHVGYRWLMAAAVPSRAGDFLYGVALVGVVFERTHSAGWVSAVAVLNRVPLVVLPALAGALADRVDRRSLMIVLDIARAAVTGVMAVLVASKGPVVVIVILGVLVATLGTPYGPASVGFMPTVVPEEDLAAANAVFGGLESLAVILGPAIGGLLLVIGSPTVAFEIDAATFLMSAAFLYKLPRVSRGEVGDEGEDGGLLAGVRALVSNLNVVVVASGLIATCFAVGATTVVYVLVSAHRLGLGSQGYGYLLAALGAGGFAGSLVADRLAGREQTATSVAGSLVLVGGGMGALAFLHAPAAAYAVTFGFGAGYTLLEILSITLIQRCLSATLLGRASGALDALSFAAVLLGAAVIAPIDNAAGLSAAVLVAAAPALAAAVIVAMTARRLDKNSEATVDRLSARIALLTHVDVLAGASRPSLERLAAQATEQAVAAGEIIVRQGDAADDFFVVVDGSVDIASSGGRAARPTHIATLSAGGAFGEIGLLESRPRTATVRAVGEVSLLRIPGDAFLAVVGGNPDLAGPFRDIVASRLARTHVREAAQ